MGTRLAKDRRFFEIMLIVIMLAITTLVYRMGGYKIIALNLYYLPIVLAGYYLGRTSAGILALLSALCVTILTMLDPTGFTPFTSPAMIALALTVWGGVLGLTALLVGTLCDERATTVEELHNAYVGVVEVLSKYLQSANPRIKAQSTRVAQLSQLVAEELRLSRKQVDDIRVGALLHDLGHVEITTQLLTKAVDALEAKTTSTARHTFLGTDLVHSLGQVLRGAVPLLADQVDASDSSLIDDDEDWGPNDVPLGAKIIRTVRAYDEVVNARDEETTTSPDRALTELRERGDRLFDPVLPALERVVRRQREITPDLAYA